MISERFSIIKKRAAMQAAALGCFAFFSCEQCDDESAADSVDLAGVYEMSAWNVPSAADLDNDGDSSANIMAESSCYDGSTIILQENGTFTQVNNSIHIEEGSFSCADTENMTGIWKRSGTVITTAAMLNGTRVERTYTITEGTAGTKLTLSLADSPYPVINSGEASWAAGAVQIEFTMRNSL